MVPSNFNPDRINQISGQLEVTVKRITEQLTHITAINDVMTQDIALKVDIVACQLKIISPLLIQPPSEINFEAVQFSLNKEYEDLHNDYIENYTTLIKSREDYLKDGVRVNLTREIRQELLARFTDNLNQKILKSKESFQIDETTNLINLKEQLEKEKKTQTKILNQIFDQKTNLTSEMNELQSGVGTQQLVKAKREFVAKKAHDIWSASEVGDLEFLKSQIPPKNPSVLSILKSKISSSKNSQPSIFDQLNHDGWAPLHLAAYNGHEVIVKFLLENGANPQLRDSEKSTPLHRAAKNGSQSIVIMLYEYNADMDAKGPYERTPLHISAYNGKVDVTAQLLNKKIDINAKTTAEDGAKTPLHEAILMHHKEIVSLLLEASKIDVNIKDINDETVFDIAVQDGLEDMLALIASHKSWKKPDLEHINKLLQMQPKQNANAIKAFLTTLRGQAQPAPIAANNNNPDDRDNNNNNNNNNNNKDNNNNYNNNNSSLSSLQRR